ncbi:PREDICTED: uncharacterized protein LOC109477730 [Branchiostoma belcheri]|uniref:Uncharacterized protein LOC109477730 n=1 Tax=Branchiostoma belcheri TaxID=7741 RepID=A0A6P4YZA4_BRABE|nr:PREDICTED: uncharacterized protein LOC109477730 [Branchiostoma belcheri]
MPKNQKKTPQNLRSLKEHTLTVSSSNVANRDGVCQDVLLFMSNMEVDLKKFLDGERHVGEDPTENQHDLSTNVGQIPSTFEKPKTTVTTSDKTAFDWKTREEDTSADEGQNKTAKDSRKENCEVDGQNGGTEKTADQRRQRRKGKAIDNVGCSAVTVAREKFESPQVSTTNFDRDQSSVQRNNEKHVGNASIEDDGVKMKTASKEGKSVVPNADAPQSERRIIGSELGRSKRERRPSARCTTCISCNACVPARRRHKSAPVRNLTSSSKTGDLASRDESFVTTNMIGGDDQGCSFFCRDCLREFDSFSGLPLHAFGNCQSVGTAKIARKDNKAITPRIIFTDEVTVL